MRLFAEISSNENWQEGNNKLASISCKDEIIDILNVRDTNLESGEISYLNEKLDLNKLEDIYLYSAPFGKTKLMSHVLLEFTFSDGKNITLSVEARRKNPNYSPWKGMFRQYGLIYIWGTHKDSIWVRKEIKKAELYKYKMELSEQDKKDGFMYFVDRTNSLVENAEYYNTITNNCTTNLWDAFQLMKKWPARSYRVLFSGLVDKHLYKLWYISNEKDFQEVKKEAKV